MNISQMRVAIRPMSTAQAVDLGTMMARHWFIPLWRIWVGVALPFFVVLYLPCLLYGVLQDSMLPLLGAFLFWWCKPLYEKPMVTWLGYALFGEDEAVAITIKQGLKEVSRYSFTLLVKKRLSTYRQLILPILQLEKPDKAQLKQRLKALSRGQGGGLTWHTFILLHVETLISVGVILIVSQLIPTSLMAAETYFTYLTYASGWTDIALALVYFFAASVIAPLYVAGGFAVYLTKRCLLEGWDVELVFKNLAHRYEVDGINPLQAAISQDRSL